MKKLILALTTVAFIGIGGSAASAAELSQPAARWTVSRFPLSVPRPALEPTRDGDGYADVPTRCVDFYVEEEVSPPATTTTTIPVTVPPQDLPWTGSGVSPILSIGALLLIGGGIVVVASRRRSDAAPST